MSAPKENGETEKNGSDHEETGRSSPRPHGLPDDILNMVGASPPKFTNFDQLMKAADGMKNMSLAHEIAVNNDFELEEQIVPPNSLEKQVRDTVQRAFWDAFDDKLNRDPPDLSMAYGMLEELKESLIGILLPQHQRLKAQIEEVLDLSLIKHQMENDAFDFEFYGRYVVETMAKLCAPARDEKIAEIKAMTEISPKFRSIMETLELMRKDMANFTIRQIRPYIQQNSIEYERKKFSEYFDAQRALGINALQYTETWLKRNYEKVLHNSSSSQMSGGSQENPMPTPANVLSQAYVEILEWTDPNGFPETLTIDHTRFMGMRDKLHMLGLITSVQLITYSVVGPCIEGVEQLKKNMKEHVEILLADIAERGIDDILNSVSEQVIKDVGDSLQSRKMTALTPEAKEALKGQISNLATRENKVRQIMLTRLTAFIHEGISGGNLSNLRVPKGCTAVQQELCQILGNFLRLSSHNRSVFGTQYAEILEKLINRSENGTNEPIAQ